MLIIFWLFAILVAIADQIVMTVIVRREYFNHRTEWESDGKPRGMFWIPKASMLGGWWVTYSSAHYFRKLAWAWLAFTPKWIADNHHTHRLLWVHRLLFPTFWICIAAPFVIAFLS